ncbi:MAG: UDP-N-acetylmuramate dehydrogenase [Oscillospiraceae bacterium]
MRDDVLEKISELRDVEIMRNEPLSLHTGFRTGGAAYAVLVPSSKQSFLDCIELLCAGNAKYYILGFGSNVLAEDNGYDGFILKTQKALCEIEFHGNTVVCGAGTSLKRLCTECANRGLGGMEFAYGIPGTVGGAVYMNAGAYDGEMKDVLVSVTAQDVDGKIKKLDVQQLLLGYRKSAFQTNNMVILSAELALMQKDKTEIMSKMEDFMNRRKEKQPLEFPSCGSTFKRPDGTFAGKLIDECGLRGFGIGGAQVSNKHCGFIVNANRATSYDIKQLIEYVRAVVLETTGYSLECEIRFL